MREIRKSGSEGGAAQANESSLPLCARENLLHAIDVEQHRMTLGCCRD